MATDETARSKDSSDTAGGGSFQPDRVASAGGSVPTGGAASEICGGVVTRPLWHAFDADEFVRLKKRYLEERVERNTELPGGMMIRGRRSRAILDSHKPEYEALKREYTRYERRGHNHAMYCLLKDLSLWEMGKAAVFPATIGRQRGNRHDHEDCEDGDDDEDDGSEGGNHSNSNSNNDDNNNNDNDDAVYEIVMGIDDDEEEEENRSATKRLIDLSKIVDLEDIRDDRSHSVEVDGKLAKLVKVKQEKRGTSVSADLGSRNGHHDTVTAVPVARCNSTAPKTGVIRPDSRATMKQPNQENIGKRRASGTSSVPSTRVNKKRLRKSGNAAVSITKDSEKGTAHNNRGTLRSLSESSDPVNHPSDGTQARDAGRRKAGRIRNCRKRPAVDDASTARTISNDGDSDVEIVEAGKSPRTGEYANSGSPDRLGVPRTHRAAGDEQVTTQSNDAFVVVNSDDEEVVDDDIAVVLETRSTAARGFSALPDGKKILTRIPESVQPDESNGGSTAGLVENRKAHAEWAAALRPQKVRRVYITGKKARRAPAKKKTAMAAEPDSRRLKGMGYSVDPNMLEALERNRQNSVARRS